MADTKQNPSSSSTKSQEETLLELIDELSPSISTLPSDPDSITRYYYFLLNRNAAHNVQFSYEEIKKAISCKIHGDNNNNNNKVEEDNGDDDDDDDEDDNDEDQEKKKIYKENTKLKLNPKTFPTITIKNNENNEMNKEEKLSNDIDLQLNEIIIDTEKDKLIINNHDLVNRDCYKVILNIINNTTKGKRCYLIFGLEGIGKTVLSYYLCYYFSHYLLAENESYNVLFISSENKFFYAPKETGIFMRIDKYEKSKNGKLVIIADDIVIEKNQYNDVDIVILLSNPYLKKYKDFQTKRSPLTLYIPQFTEKETKKYYKGDYIIDAEMYGYIPGLFMHDPDDDDNFIKALTNEFKMQLRGLSMMDFFTQVISNPENGKINLSNISCYKIDKYDLTKLNGYDGISKCIMRMSGNIFGGIGGTPNFCRTNETRIKRKIENEIYGDLYINKKRKMDDEKEDEDDDDDDEKKKSAPKRRRME